MAKPNQLFEIEQQYHYLLQSGSYAEALELVTSKAHLFPDYSQKVVYSWRVGLACRLNDAHLAVCLLQEAIEAGHWYNDLLDDPDLLILHNVPEFERIVSICSERREQAIAQAAQVIQIITPQRGLEPYPLLFTLHGAQSNIVEFAPHWLTAAEQGWMLALPQSSQAYGPGSFSWNDWDWARQELQKHFEAICTQYPIDRNRVVLAGFSQGGGLAAWLGLTEAISACGLLLVGPFLENADSTLAWIKDRHTPGIKAYLVAGQRDIYCLGIARKLAKILPQHNIPTKLDEYPDSEHSFPIDFEQRLPEALKFLV